MPYLTLNGVDIPCQRGGLLEPSRYGETVRMYNNVLRSTEEPLFRTRRWSFTTGPLDGAEWDVIAPLIRSVALRTAGGYAVTRGAVGISVLCVPGDVTHEPKGETDIRYVASFTCYERTTATAGVGGPTSGVYLSATGDPYDDGAGGVYKTAPINGGIDSGYVGISGPDPATPIAGCGSGTPCSVAQCPPVTYLLDKYITGRLNPAVLSGPGYLYSSGIFINPWGTWYRASLGMQMSLVRTGVGVVAGPFPFTTSGTSFAGGPISMQLVSPLSSLNILLDDRLMFQFFTVMGMNGCRSDDGFRPSMGTGGTNTQILLPGILTLAP